MNKLRIPLTGFYMVFFSIYSLMTRFTWTAALIDGNINAVLYRLLLVSGCFLALWWLVAGRRELKALDFVLWAAFSAVLCISTLLNYSYNLMENVFGILTFGFQLVVFYLMGRTLSDTEWNTTIKRIILPCSLLWNIACAGSLIQFFLNISYTTQYAADHGSVRQGITDGRLFGLFSDPNFAAFTSLLLVFGLWHILSHTKSKMIRIYIWSGILLHVIYIIMSNSRTVYLSVIGSILFYVLLSFYKKIQKEKLSGITIFRKLFLRGIITLFVLVAAYFIILTPLRSVARLICPDRNTAVEMKRDDVSSDNISNNRFTIWQEYIKLYKEKPLFGFSTRSALPYVEKNHPESYLAKTKYVTHNSYLSLLVETGAVGFLVMLLFMFLLLSRTVKRIRTSQEISDTYLLFSSWLVSILIFCLCFHDIFFTLNLETMLFFCSLGYLWKK